MKTIELPVIHRPMPLNDIVAKLHDSDRSAAIFFSRPTAPRIIMFQDVVRALRFGNDDIEHVRFQLAWLGRPPNLTRADDVEVSDASRALRAFRRTPYAVGILQAHRDLAVVAAKDNRIMRTLSVGPPDCFCRGPRMHSYRRPAPPTCPHDRTAIDCY